MCAEWRGASSFGNQARCRHQFADLLWTANQHGHFARCSRCDLKHVIYYSVRHGVLMVNQVLENACPDPEAGPIWTPGLAVADTGCRTSVGGVRWHQAYQAELRRRGVTWQTVEEKETFQFGSGSPVTSKRAFLYPVALVPGQVDVLRMSEVDGQAASCPGLVGPSELSRWSVQFDFRTRELVILDNRQPMHLTPTRHPALDLVTYLPEGDPWKQPGMLEKARLLRQAPQSLAFVAAAPATMGDDVYLQDTSEEPTEEERSTDQSGDPRHWRDRCRRGRQDEEKRWLEYLENDLGVKVIGELPVIPNRGQEASSTASSQLQAGDDDARFSVTSHEFGVELVSSEEEGESDEEMIPDEVFLEQGPVKFLHKEKRKKLNQAARAVQELASAGRCGTTPTTLHYHLYFTVTASTAAGAMANSGDFRVQYDGEPSCGGSGLASRTTCFFAGL